MSTIKLSHVTHIGPNYITVKVREVVDLYNPWQLDKKGVPINSTACISLHRLPSDEVPITGKMDWRSMVIAASEVWELNRIHIYHSLSETGPGLGRLLAEDNVFRWVYKHLITKELSKIDDLPGGHWCSTHYDANCPTCMPLKVELLNIKNHWGI